MNRFDRINAIFVHLQARQIVRAQELADRFNISLRTVYRDIRSLEQAGVPVSGEAGVGYSLLAGYRLPPVMFTKDEALTFIMADKLMTTFTDPASKASFQSAMDKVRAVLRADDKQMLQQAETNLAVIRRFPPPPNAAPDAIAILLESVQHRKTINISYQSLDRDETTSRDIEPIGVLTESGVWYTVAYCHLRRAYRNFRTDRIRSITRTDTPFTINHPTLREYLDNRPGHGSSVTVVLRLSPQAARYLQNQKHLHGWQSESEADGAVDMTFRYSSLQSFATWYLTFAEHAQIISPPELIDVVRARLQKISGSLKDY